MLLGKELGPGVAAHAVAGANYEAGRVDGARSASRRTRWRPTGRPSPLARGPCGPDARPTRRSRPTRGAGPAAIAGLAGAHRPGPAEAGGHLSQGGRHGWSNRLLRSKRPPRHGAVLALADSHHNIGILLRPTGKPAEAVAAYQRARSIRQKLADANPAVTGFQRTWPSHTNLGRLLSATGKPAEAEAYRDGAGDPAEAGRRQPHRHRIPQPPGGQPQQPRHPADARQAGRGGGGLTSGAGDPAEAGRRQPRRHRLPAHLAASHTTSAGCWADGQAGRGGGRTRRPWRSGRSWPTPTPPSPSSRATWQPATTTSALLGTRASQRRRWRPTSGAGRSSRSWPTTTPPSPTSRPPGRQPQQHRRPAGPRASRPRR